MPSIQVLVTDGPLVLGARHEDRVPFVPWSAGGTMGPARRGALAAELIPEPPARLLVDVLGDFAVAAGEGPRGDARCAAAAASRGALLARAHISQIAAAVASAPRAKAHGRVASRLRGGSGWATAFRGGARAGLSRGELAEPARPRSRRGSAVPPPASAGEAHGAWSAMAFGRAQARRAARQRMAVLVRLAVCSARGAVSEVMQRSVIAR